MNWHEPTKDEIDGVGEYTFLVDIVPGDIPHQAGTDGDALIRIGRPGWNWIVKDFRRKEKRETLPRVTMGESETRPAAIADAQAELARLRAET